MSVADTWVGIQGVESMQKGDVNAMTRPLELEAQIGRGRSIIEGLADGKARWGGIIVPQGKARSREKRGIFVTERFRLNHLGYLGDFSGFVSKSAELPHHLKLALGYSSVPSLCGVSFDRDPSEQEEIIVNGFDGGIYLMTEKNREILARYSRGTGDDCNERMPLSLKSSPSLSIRANADNDFAIKAAFAHGAEGIGLCRTGYVFFRSEHHEVLRRFLLGREKRGSRKVFEVQRDEFEKILKCVPEGFPITVRLWDMPLSEYFMEIIEEDPALGRRGVRLGFLCKELYELQIEALAGAYACLAPERRPVLEVLVPFVSYAGEFTYWRDFIRSIGSNVRIGSMIETPRSIMAISEFAGEADFLCIGSNDMTQLFLGMSRNDSEVYFTSRPDIYGENPFEAFDPWLKKLILQGLREARKVNPSIRCGIVGSHASFPENLAFLREARFDYISVNYANIGIIRSCFTGAVN